MTESKKLVCLFPWLEVGGADKFNLDLLGCLKARGWTATVITTLPSQHPWKSEFSRVIQEHVDLARHPPDDRPSQLVQLLRERSPAVLLLSHACAGYRLLPLLRHELPQLAIADYCHMEELNWGHGGFPRLSANHTRLLDLQLVSSQHLKEWICQRGGEPNRTRVCPTNIDTADWDPGRHDRDALRTAMSLGATTPVILYAGRLVRQKQPVLAAEIMRRTLREIPEAVFLVAGDGLFTGYLRAYIHHHRLEHHLRLLGQVSNQRMRELLVVSDIFFLPSLMEGISLAIFEAMAMKVVPVSAQVGGQAELVTPDCGILVHRGPREMADYTQALVSLIRRPTELARMAVAARNRVQAHFRLDQMGDQMESALRQATAWHDHQPRPAVGEAAARQATQEAIAAARLFEVEARSLLHARPTWRRRMRAAYWRAVEKGAWRLVPLVEKSRHWVGLS